MTASGKKRPASRKGSPSSEPDPQRFRDLIELLPQAVFELNAAGEIVYANRTGLELFRLGVDDLRRGLNMLDMISPSCRDRALKSIAELMNGRPPRVTEYDMRRTDGSTFPAEIHSSVIMRDGAYAGLRGIIVDMSPKLAEQRALRESEERLQALIQNVPIGIALLAPDGTPLFLNPHFIRIFGYALDDLPDGNAWFNKAFPDSDARAAAFAAFSAGIDNSAPGIERIHQVRCKNGSMKTVQFSVVALGDRRIVVSAVDVSSRIAMERSLRESEFRYKIITELTSDYIFLIDFDESGAARISFVTDNFTAITGRTLEEVRSVDDWSAIFHPADRERAMRLVAETFATGRQVNFECRTFLKSGEMRWIRIDARPFKDDTGSRVTSIVGAIKDITERKAVEEALKESRDELDFITGNMIDLLSHADPTGHYRYTSPSYQTVLGYSADELRTMSGFDIVHPDDIHRVHATYIDAVIQHLPAIRYETRLRHKGGNYIPFEVNVKILYRADGRLESGIITARNITERYEAERALRESEARYRAIFENATEGIFQTTPAGRYLTVNPSFARMFGYAMPEDMIQAITDIGRQLYVDPDERERFKTLLAERGHVEGFEAQMRHRDGSTFWISINAHVVKDSSWTVLYYEGTNEDITDRKRAREDLNASLREKETLLKEIHHRVKNNFQIISSLMNLQRQRISDERLRAQFSDAMNRIAAMAGIHDRLYRSPDLSRVEFAAYIADITTELMRGSAQPGRSIALALDTEPVEVPVENAIPCALMLNEIVSNSLKHAFPDGWKGAPEIRITLHRGDAGRVELVIADNGVGIPADAPGHTRSLGLKIIPLLVQQIGGTHRLETDGGTRHRITFGNP